MNAIVNTRDGTIRGSIADGVYSFKGIPYAAPPFGANRLLPPQPVEPWSGVRDALAYGPKCPQPAYPPEIAVLLPPEIGGAGEDCLTVNVWSA
jgi:para-nitrobenzyl esterase